MDESSFIKEFEERMLACGNERAQLLDSIFNNIFQLMAILSPDGELLAVNEAALQICGVKKSDVLGRKFWDTAWWSHSKEVRLNLIEKIDEARAGNSMKFETTFSDADGGIRTLENNINPVKNEKGGVVFIISMGRDITDNKKHIDSLVKSEQKYRYLTENISDVVWECDLNFHFSFISSSVYKFLGYTADEFLKFSLNDLIAKSGFYDIQKRLVAEMTEIVSGGLSKYKQNSFLVEVQCIHKNGDLIWAEITYSYRFNSDNNLIGIFGVARNVTERKKNENELKETKKQLEKNNHELKTAISEAKTLAKAANEANEAKNRFLANMSHEIRTPMNGILGFIRLLTETALSEKQQEYIKIINFSSNHLLDLIKDMLDYSKIEVGQLKLDYKPVNLKDFIQKMYDIFWPQCFQKGITLIFDSDDSIDRLFYIDELRFKQIISNLLSNAIKFTENGEIYFCVTLNSIVDNMALLSIIVSDTGIGIEAGNIEKIFDRFYQIDDSNIKKYQGSGLGLAIVKGLVEMMGGKIYVESRPEKGSRFIVELNALLDENSSSISASNSLQDNNKSAAAAMLDKKIKILAVEDDQISCLLLSTLATINEWEIFIVHNGREACETYSRQEFDVVLMDVQMPEMNGIEATIAIREIERVRAGKRIPIIAITAYALEGDCENFIKSGMDDYISKPFEESELIAKIKKYLG